MRPASPATPKALLVIIEAELGVEPDPAVVVAVVREALADELPDAAVAEPALK